MRSRLCMSGRCLRAAAGRSYSSSFLLTERFGVIGKKVCPEPNRNPCDKGRLHAGHSIAQQCPSAPPLHLFR